MKWGTNRVRGVEDVAAFQLCCGCGACAYVCPDEIRMVDVLEQGRRPAVQQLGRTSDSNLGAEALAVCPGIGLDYIDDGHETSVHRDLQAGWGPILELWEGYSTDPEIRHAGSSGGAASALAFFAMQHAGMHGVLHTAARDDAPYLNETVMSRSRADLLERTGSRYAPASPCDGLALIENAPGPCVFIGKPCDVAAAGMAARLRPNLARNIGLKIAFFCAGTPSTRGTLEMIETMGIDDPSSVLSVRYRGRGWPGSATVRFRGRNGNEEERQLSYEQSWGDILQKHRQWRCHICPDHTGEFADLAVGDPWYRPIEPGEPGRSLILARTERGRRILDEAIRGGYLDAVPIEASQLIASQPHFEAIRGKIWGRILALRLLGIPAPKYRRFPLFRLWMRRLSWGDRVRSVLGTARRVFRKRLWRPVSVVPCRAPSSSGART